MITHANGSLQHLFPLPEWCEGRRGNCGLAAVPLDAAPDHRTPYHATVLALAHPPAILGTKAMLTGSGNYFTMWVRTGENLWRQHTHGHDGGCAAWYNRPENAHHFAVTFGERII